MEARQELVGGVGDAVVAVAHACRVVAREVAHDVVAADLLDEPVVERSRLNDRFWPDPVLGDEFPGGYLRERGAQVLVPGGTVVGGLRPGLFELCSRSEMPIRRFGP